VEPERSVNGRRAADLPDESTNLRFRHLLEEHQLAPQGLATSIAEPSSTKNSGGERDPEMQQNNKGTQWTFLSGIAESTGTFA
jgi:IS5 family transposase